MTGGSHLDLVPHVGGALGTVMVTKDWRFQYTFVRRSEELSHRRPGAGGIHDYGSISIGVERSF